MSGLFSSPTPVHYGMGVRNVTQVIADSTQMPSKRSGSVLAPMPDVLSGGFQQSLQFALYRLVAGNDMLLGEHGVGAVDIGDEAAGLAQDDDAGRDVPRRDIALPIAVEPSGRDEGHVERRGAESPQPRNLVLDSGQFTEPQVEVAAAE